MDLLDDYFAACAIATLALLLVYLSVRGIASMSVESRCLRAGYSSYSVAWNMAGYCIKRIDQTDHVVPVGEVSR